MKRFALMLLLLLLMAHVASAAVTFDIPRTPIPEGSTIRVTFGNPFTSSDGVTPIAPDTLRYRVIIGWKEQGAVPTVLLNTVTVESPGTSYTVDLPSAAWIIPGQRRVEVPVLLTWEWDWTGCDTSPCDGVQSVELMMRNEPGLAPTPTPTTPP